MDNLTYILIFKTTVKTNRDKAVLAEVLDDIKEIEEWSVDCDDVDCVLRVVSYTLGAKEIISLVNRANFQCYELD